MILSLSHTNTRAHTPQLIHQEIRRFYLQNLLESEFSSPPAVLPSSTATGSWLLWWSLNQPLDFCPSSPSGLLTKKAKVRAFFLRRKWSYQHFTGALWQCPIVPSWHVQPSSFSWLPLRLLSPVLTTFHTHSTNFYCFVFCLAVVCGLWNVFLKLLFKCVFGYPESSLLYELLLSCGALASHCSNFSCCGAWALGQWASVVVAPLL